jgi:hypothetical protein
MVSAFAFQRPYALVVQAIRVAFHVAENFSIDRKFASSKQLPPGTAAESETPSKTQQSPPTC